mgnify:CR=1 FL=1|jgi:hypothetical protein
MYLTHAHNVNETKYLLSKHLFVLNKWRFDGLIADKIDKAHVVKAGLVIDPQEPEIDCFHMLTDGVVSPVE